MNVDLDRVLALDAAATPGPWEKFIGRRAYSSAILSGVALVADNATVRDAELAAFYRVAAPEMARTLKELREMAENARLYQPGTSRLIRAEVLIDAVLRVAAPSDEAEAEGE